MSVKLRIYLLPVLSAVSLLFVLGVNLVLGSRTGDLLARLELGFVPAVELYRDLDLTLGSVQRTLLDAVSAEDAEGLEKVDELKQRLLARLTGARSNPVLEAASLDELQKNFTTYVDHARATAARMIHKDPKAAPEIEVMSERYKSLQAQLLASTQKSHAQSAAAFEQVRAGQRTSQLAVLLAVIASALVMGYLSFRLAARFIGALSRLTRVANDIAAGDLSLNVEVGSTDEIGSLATAFSTMVSQLRDVHRSIEDVARGLVASASQINAAAREQEAASQTQSSSVEEVNRTMQSLLESATHIATSATGVSTNAERTRETALTTSKKISELSAHTNRMSETLETIREIADRTDLLALNASLEGTRAGEAGRGFSLVANEMRRLSERVTLSVRDVKDLVNDIRASGASTVMVTEEARALADNTAASAKQITMATQQQRSATEMVSTSMKEVAMVLVETVAATTQTKRAADDLANQAGLLSKLVSRFKVGAQQ
jgi:methyl-accepting chemotaxis protein